MLIMMRKRLRSRAGNNNLTNLIFRRGVNAKTGAFLSQ